jgi:hypothetical protein
VSGEERGGSAPVVAAPPPAAKKPRVPSVDFSALCAAAQHIEDEISRGASALCFMLRMPPRIGEIMELFENERMQASAVEILGARMTLEDLTNFVSGGDESKILYGLKFLLNLPEGRLRELYKLLPARGGYTKEVILDMLKGRTPADARPFAVLPEIATYIKITASCISEEESELLRALSKQFRGVGKIRDVLGAMQRWREEIDREKDSSKARADMLRYVTRPAYTQYMLGSLATFSEFKDAQEKLASSLQAQYLFTVQSLELSKKRGKRRNPSINCGLGNPLGD